MKDLKKVKYLILDMDGCVYHPKYLKTLFSQVSNRMTDFIALKLNIDKIKAKEIQSDYFYKYDTSLNGLMKNYPDSIDPKELEDLIRGSKSIHKALGGNKEILIDEKPTIDFAYACVVSIDKILEGEILTKKNIWVKRPGLGGILAEHFQVVLGKKASRDILNDEQLTWEDFE